jgi:hypothetical protein
MGGEGPISYQALSTYARDHGILGSEFRVFRAFMGAMDAEWLKYRAVQDKAKADQSNFG